MLDSTFHSLLIISLVSSLFQVYHIRCEQQYIALVSYPDADGRNCLHYAASSRGFMVTALLTHQKNRFTETLTHPLNPPQGPLFPQDGWVCPSTGSIWVPNTQNALLYGPSDPPEGYLSVRSLRGLRSETSFIDARDADNATALHYATVASDVSGIRQLLAYGSEPFVFNSLGASPLDLATQKSVRDALMPLQNAVEASIGRSMRRAGIRTPSSASVGMSRRSVADDGGISWHDGMSTVSQRKTASENALIFLVNSGEDINQREGIKLQAPLHLAAQSGATDIVQLLISHGAIIDIGDVDGYTPLHYAAMGGTERHLGVVQLLYNAGADINATSVQRKTPLHLAATGGPKFTPGTDLVPRSKTRRLAGGTSTLRGTQKSRTNPNMPPLYEMEAPVTDVTESGFTDHHDHDRHRKGKDVEGGGGYGGVSDDSEAESQDGAEFGEDAFLNTMTQDPNTYCSGIPGGNGDGNNTMIRLLHSLGASLEAEDVSRHTPLHAAAERGNHLGAYTLLLLGANIYATDLHEQTCLHLAAFAKHTAVCRLLVRWDAEIGKLKFMQDSNGRTAYDMSGSGEVREALHTLWEASASGSLDITQSVQRQASLLPQESYAPWLPVRTWETTRVLQRSVLHTLATGAARAMAILRQETTQKLMKAKATSNAQALSAISVQSVSTVTASHATKVATEMSRAIAQRRAREARPDPKFGTGLPSHPIATSAVHILAGVGFRFTGSRKNRGPLPPHPYRNWGGDLSDVHLTFPVPKDPYRTSLFVDMAAYVPKSDAHTMFYPQSILGQIGRSETSSTRALPGTELTTSQVEKNFARVLDFFIRLGFEPDIGDIDGVTPLMLCAKYGLLYLLRKLLLLGANIALTDKHGNNCLHYAYAYKQFVAAKIVAEFSTADSFAEGQLPETSVTNSVFEASTNRDNMRPADMVGVGVLLMPDSTEKALEIPRLQDRSDNLRITHVF